MSQWKFNDFETNIDFTDADFMERFENGYDEMMKHIDKVPKTGKISEIIRGQCKVFDAFFSDVFGEKSVEKMFLGKTSVEMRIEACNSLYDFKNREQQRFSNMSNKYRPNRQQIRSQYKKNYRK